MLIIKKHRILNALLFLLFSIYAMSPLVSSCVETQKNIANEYNFKVKDISIFFVDFLCKLVTQDDVDCNPPDDENVIVKKKRAVLRGFEKIEPLRAAIIAYEISDDLSAHNYIHTDFRIKDHKSNPKTFKGFLPLYSGVSPPIV